MLHLKQFQSWSNQWSSCKSVNGSFLFFFRQLVDCCLFLFLSSPGDQQSVAWCPWLQAHEQCLKLLNISDLLRCWPLVWWSLCPPAYLDAGAFLACKDLGGRFDDSFSTWPFFFFKWRSARVHQLHFFFQPGSGHSGSVRWDDCGRVFSDKLRVNLFSLIGSCTMPRQHSQPALTLLDQGCLRV